MPTYLHGVETIDVDVAGQTARIVRSGVIGLLGIAPTGDKNSLKLCNTIADDAQFGKPLPGFNIPKTLQIIRAIAGNCPVLVVNIFDSTTHTATITNEAQVVTNGKLKLAFAPIGAVDVKLNDGVTDATIVKGTDYTLDEYGNFKVISTAISNGTTYKFTYKKLDSTAVANSDVIGAYNSGTGARTGLELFDTAFNTFGFYAKILVSPGYINVAAISTAIKAKAPKYRAVVLQDAPAGTTVSGAISGRGVSGTIGFNTSDERVMLLFPFIKCYDTATDSYTDYPYSAFMAAIVVKNDYDRGYWYSPSNKNIPFATGVERIIGWNISDSGCDANLLNDAGITTAVSGFGTGLRTWGNRNASYPASTSVKNFINILRIDDVLTESLEQSTLEDIDQPLTQAFIDNMRQKGNALMAKLIQDGAIFAGSQVLYDPADNPPSELAAGRVVFQRIYMGATPAERITFKNKIDTNLLGQLG